MTRICVIKLGQHCSAIRMSLVWHQAIIWTNAGILTIEPFQWNINQNPIIFIDDIAIENAVYKMSTICLGLNVFISLRATPDAVWWQEWVFSREGLQTSPSARTGPADDFHWKGEGQLQGELFHKGLGQLIEWLKN